MTNTLETKKPTSRSGPRAPAGKRQLTAIMDETVIEESKIKAIRQKTNLSRVIQRLLQDWLDGPDATEVALVSPNIARQS